MFNENDTELYYLQSRYYDSNTCRFINADAFATTGQGLLGNNTFVYCCNSPIIHSDSSGLKMVAASNLSSGPPALEYDVEIFDQENRPMCWAYCQAMIEAFRQGWGNQSWARTRAMALGMEAYGIFKWRQAGWPTNRGKQFEINDIGDIYHALKGSGPFYAYYANQSNTQKHLVVVTGVDPSKNIVYTNNPWGVQGEQTFDEFLNGVAWDEPSTYGMTFQRAYYAE